jgi:membrane protease subunit (stomatin/prohibitin family)
MALIDIVQFHGNDREFVWKFPSENLRLGTQLVVKPAQVAFFVYRGKICDEVLPGAITLSTGNIPLLTTLVSLPFGGIRRFRRKCGSSTSSASWTISGEPSVPSSWKTRNTG